MGSSTVGVKHRTALLSQRCHKEQVLYIEEEERLYTFSLYNTRSNGWLYGMEHRGDLTFIGERSVSVCDAHHTPRAFSSERITTHACRHWIWSCWQKEHDGLWIFWDFSLVIIFLVLIFFSPFVSQHMRRTSTVHVRVVSATTASREKKKRARCWQLFVATHLIVIDRVSPAPPLSCPPPPTPPSSFSFLWVFCLFLLIARCCGRRS